MQSDYDFEVRDLCDALKREHVKHEIQLIEGGDVESIFLESQRSFKPLYGGIDWSNATELGFINSLTLASNPLEALQEVLWLYDRFCGTLKIEEDSKLVVLSDDFYGLGVRVDSILVKELLKRWLPLPHAIFIFTEDLRGAFHVTFSRDIHFGVAL